MQRRDLPFNVSVPAPTARFRPRAEDQFLRTAVDNAWADYSDSVADADVQAEIGRRIADLVEARIPASDLEVLERYGCVEPVENVTIRLWSLSPGKSYGDWSETFGVKLPRPVKALRGYVDFSAGGPLWHGDAAETRGVTAGYRDALIAKGEWEAFKADQDKREAAALPRDLVPYFEAALEFRKRHRAEYRLSTEGFSAYKAEHGVYPTWAEIEAMFPVLGTYMAKVRAEAAAKKVAA